MSASVGLHAVVAVSAYLLGSVPFGLILGKALSGVDVRRTGSGNIGATNVARSLGMGAGALTLLLDVSKGALAAWAGGSLLGPGGGAVAGLAATLGHIVPITLGFRGGKGVATGLGAFLVVDPPAALGAVAIFALAVALSRRVSVGSVLGSVALPLLVHLRGAPGMTVAAAWACSLLVVFRHKDNMMRLLHGTEPRLGEKRS